MSKRTEEQQAAIGLEEGETLAVTVVVRRGEITIRRRGKF